MKLIHKFIENSLQNLGFVGINYKGNRVVGRRKDGTDTWTNNNQPISKSEAKILIDRRFK